MIEEITLSVIQDILNDISKAKEVAIDKETLTFKYKDKDNDNILVMVTIEDDEKIICTFPMKIPEGNLITATIGANMYNTRKDAHGTFAYTMASDDTYFIALETDILTRGGISEASIKYDLRNFIQHIDSFEAIIASAIKEHGPDSSFLKSSKWSAFWEGAGAFLSGYMQE